MSINNGIIWTQHASLRALQRGIDKEIVEEIVKNPTEVIQDNSNGNLKCFRNAYQSEPKFLIVVYTIYNRCIKIITVMRTDKGGLRADGFNNV